MATPSDKDDRSEDASNASNASNEHLKDSDDARTGEAEEKASDDESAEETGGDATEADVGRREGDSTASSDDKGSAFAKQGKAAGVTRAPRAGGKRAGGKGARSRTPVAPVTPVRAQGGSLAKSVLLFVVVVGGLAAGFALLGQESGGGRAAPTWKVGQQVDVEITLVKTDVNDLTCAASEEIAGRHCAQEAQNKPWSKGPAGDDKKLLRPYTTTNGAELLAAGLWSEPAMAQATLPATRFTVKCKFTVEGKVKKPSIRWASDRPWYDSAGDWHSGVVSGCTVTP